MWSYLLESGECAESQVLLDTVGPEHDGGGEEGRLRDIAGHVGTLHHALLPGHALDQGVGEPATKIRQGTVS